MGSISSASDSPFAELFERMPHGVLHCRVIYDGERPVDLLAVRANPAFQRLMPFGDPTGRRVTEIMPVPFDPAHYESVLLVAAGGGPDKFERHFAPLGRWLSISSYSPAPGEFVAVIEDVTARRQAEAAAREHDVQFRAMIDGAAIGVMASDARTGRLLQANEALCAMVGYTREELLALDWLTLTHPDDRPRSRSGISGVVAGRPLRIEKRYLHKSGHAVWVRVNASVAPSIGDVPVTLAFIEDITAQRESEARFTALFEGASVGMAQVDTERGRVVDVNEALCRMLGYSREELIRGNWQDVIVPEDVASGDEILRSKVTKPGSVAVFDKRYRRKDGTVMHARVTAVAPLMLTPGTPHLSIVEDTSARRDAEDKSRELNDQLELVLRLSQVAVAVTDAASERLVDVNDAFVKLLGRSREELIGRRSSDLGLYASNADRDRIFSDFRATGVAVPRELKVKTRAGEERDVLMSVGLAHVGGARCGLALLQDITELRRVARAREESQARFRAIFDGATVGIAQVDPETYCTVDVNDALCRMLGYSREELMVGRWSDFTVAEDVASAEAAVLDAKLHDRPSYSLETRYVRKDGSTLWARVTVSKPASPEGGLPHLAIVQDISAQREAEEKSRDLDAQLSTVQRLSNAAVMVTQLSSGRIKDVNHAFEQTFGWSRAEAIGKTSAELGFYTAEADREAILAELRSHGAAAPRELRIRPRVGPSRVLLFSVGVAELGGERCAVGVMHDVTALREADTGRRESEERYRVFVDNLDDVVFSSDAAGALTFVNSAVARFGYRPEQVVGRHLAEFAHPDDAPALREEDGSSATPLEWRLMDAAGKPRFVRSTSRELGRGAERGMTGVIVDQTLQRETELELRAAQKMEAVGRLAGGIAHDFNNILTVILSYTEATLEELREEDPLHAELREIDAAGRRAATLTRQLLAFSRRQVFEVERVDLDALVDGLARMLRRVIGEDVHLSILPGDAVWPLRADKGQLEQVLMNLVVNARDAMPAGGDIRIATSNVELDHARAVALGCEPGRYVRLEVADTGVGMDEATRSRVFEPFFTTKPVGKGTGLGLSTVYGIVKQSRGAIEVESFPGYGTSFRVLLPRDELGPASVLAPSTTRAPGKGSETVLVVEDEAAVRSVVGRILRAAGYRVLLAANGDEAAATLAKERNVDLLLTDVIMPGIGGRELAQSVRSTYSGTRVLFVSGYSDVMDHDEERLAGHFLSKPFDRKALLAKVRSVLDGPLD